MKHGHLDVTKALSQNHAPSPACAYFSEAAVSALSSPSSALLGEMMLADAHSAMNPAK
jgi:hypothetical protein